MRTRILVHVLGWIAVAGSGAVLVAEWWPTASARRPPQGAQAEPPATLPAISAAAPQATMEMVERPLFFASRRPLPPEPPVVPEVKPEPPPKVDFALTGTVLAQESRLALIQPEKAKPVVAGLGDAIGRWTITSIDADRIKVRSGAIEQFVGVRDKAPASNVLPPEMRPGAAPPAITPPRNPVTQPPVPHGQVRR